MDRAWLRRMRWRRRGAWMWPSFVALTLADAVIGRLLPPSGDSQTVLGAGLVAAFLNLAVVVIFRRPFGALLRRFRADLPKLVARDYAGTFVLACVAGGLLLAGL